MSQRILKPNGRVVPRRTVRPLNDAKIHSEVEKKKRKLFDKLIEGRWGNTVNPPKINNRVALSLVRDLMLVWIHKFLGSKKLLTSPYTQINQPLCHPIATLAISRTPRKSHSPRQWYQS